MNSSEELENCAVCDQTHNIETLIPQCKNCLRHFMIIDIMWYSLAAERFKSPMEFALAWNSITEHMNNILKECDFDPVKNINLDKLTSKLLKDNEAINELMTDLNIN